MNQYISALRGVFRKRWDKLWCRSHPHLRRLGEGSAWNLRTDLLTPKSVVLSGGVGRDISFELQLAREYKCRIFLFDPSPTGRETMRLPENQHPLIEYLDLGLAGTKKTVAFSPPKNSQEGSYSIPAGPLVADVVSFECISISEFLRERGIPKLDVLKLDIEGFEYEVLQDVLANRIVPQQLCVEFHDFLPGIPLSRTLGAIRNLRKSGLRLVHKDRCDLTFVRT
jgi:FkbM family methyltransferase